MKIFSYIVVVIAVALVQCNSLVIEVLNSTISDVTLAGNTAEITRSFKLINLPQGPHSAVITHLPNTLDERSIKVTGRGGGQVVSTSMSSRLPSRENDAKFSKLITQLEIMHGNLTDQLKKVDFEITDLDARLKSVGIYLSAYERNGNITKTIKLQTEMLNFYADEMRTGRAKQHDLESLKQATVETLSTVHMMRDQLLNTGYYKNLFLHPAGERKHSHSTLFPSLHDLPAEDGHWPLSVVEKKLTIHFFVLPFEETVFDRELTFAIKYMASPAQWQAEYDVRVESEPTGSGAVTLRVGLFALVTQSTREDWNEAMLHLSTATPQLQIAAPIPPASTTVRFQQQQQQQREDRGGAEGIRRKMSTQPSNQPANQPSFQPSAQPSFQPSSQPTSQPSGSPSMVPSAAPSAVPSVNPTSARSSSAFSQEQSAQQQERQEQLRREQEVLRQEQQRAQAERNRQEMADAAVGSSGKGGSIAAAVKFHLPYPVTVPSNHKSVYQPPGQPPRNRYASNHLPPVLPTIEAAESVNTRLFIREMAVTPHVFTYVVPTAGVTATAYLRAWNLPNATRPANTDTSAMPLLSSNNARIFVEDTYVGTTSMPATQPGATLRLDLGQDRNIEVKSAFVVPRRGSRSEDKSTWFVTDKVKYQVEVVEYSFTVRSTHDVPHLVVLSEYLPQVGEEGIQIELLQPSPASLLSVRVAADGSGAGASANAGAFEKKKEEKKKEVEDEQLLEMWSEEDFIAAVLKHPTLARPATATTATASTSTSTSGSSANTDDTASCPDGSSPGNTSSASPSPSSSSMYVFSSKGSRNLVWAMWVQPGQSVQAGLKYRIIWPEAKNIQKR